MAPRHASQLTRAFYTALILGAIAVAALVVVTLALPAGASSGLDTEDLTGPLAPPDLANDLLGGGIAVTNVSYTGDNSAAGTFTGGAGIIGFDSGVILSTGDIADVAGPNVSALTGTAFGSAGDSDLDGLSGFTTFDAAVLEFDFLPETDSISFQYVFASEEYNEFVGSSFNDVFAFYVNDVNCAVVQGGGASGALQPVSINTINNGQPFTSATNPNLYINNDPFNPDSTGDTVPIGDLRNTEMDGLTVVLTCNAPVNAGDENHMKLAIADASDPIYDAAVFIKAGSFTAFTPGPTGSGGPTPGGSGLIQGDNDCDSEPDDPDVDAVDALVSLQENAGFSYNQEPGCPEIGGALPASAVQQFFGDVDCDDDVDAVDALQILRFVAGLAVNQAQGCTHIGDEL